MQIPLTFSAVDSHVSRTPLPGNEKAKTMTDTSGLKCVEQFEKLNHVGSLAKMLGAYLIGVEGWYSMRCVLTWKILGIKSRPILYLRPRSMPLTNGNEFGLLPTVTTMDSTNATAQMKSTQVKEGSMHSVTLARAMAMGLLPTPNTSDATQPEKIETYLKRKERKAKEGINLQFPLRMAMAMGMLPTPNTRDWKDNVGNGRDAPSIGVTRGYSLGQKINSLLPTPMASDCGDKVTGLENQDSLVKMSREITGKPSQLSPQFVMEMMGFPTDWTLLPFLNGETNQSKPEEMQ